MRYLHPVLMSEAFVASGIYTVIGLGETVVAEESWTFHEFPDGAWKIRVDHDRRMSGDASILIEAWRAPESAGAHIERFDISAFGPNDAPVQHVRSTYSVVGDSLEVGRTVDRGERVYESIALAGSYVLHPGGVLFSGLALAEQMDSTVPLPVLNANWLFERETGFQINELKWDVAADGDSSQTIDGMLRTGVKWFGSINDVTLNAVVDEHGILLAGQIGDEYISLNRYARRSVHNQ